MLAPILSTEDPYAAATTFCQAGWKLESDTSRERADARAEVSLAGSRVVLVRRPAPASSEPESVARLGAGIELKVTVPPQELSGLFLLHRSGWPSATSSGNQRGSGRSGPRSRPSSSWWSPVIPTRTSP